MDRTSFIVVGMDPMTSHELAEKITQMIRQQKYEGFGSASLVSDLESLLTEAMEEVRREQHDFEMKLTRPFVLQAKSEAYEDAAKIAEEDGCGATFPNADNCDCNVDIAEKIRQRAKEVK